MLRLVSRRAPMARQPLLRASVLSIALSSAFAVPAFAQTTSNEKALPAVEVTGARFINNPVFSPIGATVITAEDIRNSGITNANEAVRKLGNVAGRNLTGTSDTSLDLRGYGSTSDNNIVILVDGVRLSENELTTALLSTISIETIERIEIIRGGSSVLYGEGATGGVIQVVTKRPAVDGARGSIVAEVGSHDQRAVRAAASKNFGPITLDVNYSKEKTDNYRRNNAVDQENYGGAIQVNTGAGRIGFRADVARSEYRLPGSLTFAQFEADPRQTLTPNNFASYDSNRYTLFGDHTIGNFSFAAEFSRRERTAVSFMGSASKTKTTIDQFSPRLRHVATTARLKNEFVVGMDLADWDYRGYSGVGTQNNRAFYLRNEVEFDKNLRVALGARHEKFKQKVVGSYDQSPSLNAWDAQVSYAVIPAVRAYIKAGQSYRIANVDENTYADVASGNMLKPQVSHDLELGAVWDNLRGDALTVRLFQQKITNEIVYDPTLGGGWGINTNLDPTRRRGIEVEGKVQLTEAFSASASVQHINATFREGAHAGKDVILVPKNIVAARVNWLSGMHNANIGAQWVDRARFGDDFSNAGTKLVPSYITVDARYALRLSQWELALSVANLLDKKYYTNGYSWQTGSLYPEAGRTVKLTARYDF